MEDALIIIAICEVIRVAQNFRQLAIQVEARRNDGRLYKQATDAFIKSLDKNDKEFFEDLIKRMEDEKNEV